LIKQTLPESVFFESVGIFSAIIWLCILK